MNQICQKSTKTIRVNEKVWPNSIKAIENGQLLSGTTTFDQNWPRRIEYNLNQTNKWLNLTEPEQTLPKVTEAGENWPKYPV